MTRSLTPVFLLSGILLYFFLSFTPFIVFAASENLIQNHSLEIGVGTPDLWRTEQSGDNAAEFQYPNIPLDGDVAARINMTNYQSGAAAWYFAEIPIKPSAVYTFSNTYTSDVPTSYVIRYIDTDGNITIVSVSDVAPSPDPSEQQFSFTTPSDASSMTVLHTIAAEGFLKVDNYSLVEEDPIPTEPTTKPDENTTIPDADNDNGTGPEGNLIANSSLEATDENEGPRNWSQGKWGTNTHSFTYPTPGANGGKAAKVEMTEYFDGDAKWYFNPVPVSENTAYTFTDSYKATVPTPIGVEYHTERGLEYEFIAIAPASEDWAQTTHTIRPPSGTTELIVFHTLDEIGTLEIDSASLVPSGSFEPTPNPAPVEPPVSSDEFFSEGMVTIAIDDGFKSTFVNGIPILNSHGLRSTQFIMSNTFGNPGYITIEDMLAMQAAGHEIGGHTKNHAHLSELSFEQARDEISGGRQDLIAVGADPVRTFTYPYGEFNNSTKEIVRDAGYIGARSTEVGYNTKRSDRYALLDQHVENHVSVAQIKEWIDTARRDRTWLIMEFHRQEEDCGDSEFCNTIETLHAVADYLVEEEIKVVTLSEGLALMDQ